MNVYISGPVSGIENYEENFRSISEIVKSRGLTPISVLDFSVLKLDSFKWSDCMKICISMLEHCDCVLMLDGWRLSVGATIEKAWATKMGMPVYYSVDELFHSL